MHRLAHTYSEGTAVTGTILKMQQVTVSRFSNPAPVFLSNLCEECFCAGMQKKILALARLLLSRSISITEELQQQLRMHCRQKGIHVVLNTHALEYILLFSSVT